MTLHEFRMALVREIQTVADQHAQDNGASMSRDIGEYRAHAGMVAGLRMAAGFVEDFMRRDDDNNE